MYGSARGRQILQYKINPNPNTNPSSPYCIMRFIFGSRVHVPSGLLSMCIAQFCFVGSHNHAITSLAKPDPFLYCTIPQRKGSGNFAMQYWFLPRSLQGVNVIILHPQVLIVRCELLILQPVVGDKRSALADRGEPCLLVYHERRQRTHNQCNRCGCCVSLHTIEYCG